MTTTFDFDAVVIGSGAGGGPVAWKLAEAGARVLVVERGKRFVRTDFDRDELHWCRRDGFIPSPHTDPHTWRSSSSELAERTSDGWISTVLGGGTVHMASYLLRADPADALQGTRCAHERGSRALDWSVPFDDVARFYDEAERDFGVTTDVPAHPLASTMDDAARRIGVDSGATPRGILFAPRVDEQRDACAMCALCSSYGCPTDARASTATTYLRRAERTGNVTIWTESLATKLVASHNTVDAVHVRRIETGEDVVVRANVVVVACGAVESARLLLLSGDAFNAHKQVGKHLWFSLCAELAGFFDAKSHALGDQLMRGSPFLNRTIHHGGFVDEKARAQFGIDRTGMFEASFAHDNPIKRAERIAVTTKPGATLWGIELKRELVRQFRGGRSVILEGFAEMLPHDGAFVDLDPDVVDAHGLPVARITFAHHDRDARICALQVEEGRALLREMGAVDVVVTRAPSETTVIQGGTCRFGEDPSTSVTDNEGRVHGFTNLFVPDGSALPSSLCAPATLTMVANALRVAPFVVARARR